LYRYFVSQSGEFCHHNPLCCFSKSVYCYKLIRGCIKKFPDRPPAARTANGTDFCHQMQLYRYFVSHSSEFCRNNPLYCFSTVYCYKRIRGCIQTFPDWPSGARDANGTVLCHQVQLCRVAIL